jgi:hypothetical protein
METQVPPNSSATAEKGMSSRKTAASGAVTHSLKVIVLFLSSRAGNLSALTRSTLLAICAKPSLKGVFNVLNSFSYSFLQSCTNRRTFRISRSEKKLWRLVRR